MSKSYSLSTIFNEQEFSQIYKIADSCNSLKEAQDAFHEFFTTVDTLKERGFSAKDMAFHVGEQVKELYESKR